MPKERTLSILIVDTDLSRGIYGTLEKSAKFRMPDRWIFQLNGC